MKNIISFDKIFLPVPKESTPDFILKFLCLENIENNTDSIILRMDGTSVIIDLSQITEATYRYKNITFHFANFNGFNIMSNVAHKTMKVDYVTDTYFEVYLKAAVTATDVGVSDGLDFNEDGELEIDVGEGLEIGEDGEINLNIDDETLEINDDNKLTVKKSPDVDSISATLNNDDLVSNVTIYYDDNSSKSYNCTYDSSGNLTSFGNVPINWS